MPPRFDGVYIGIADRFLYIQRVLITYRDRYILLETTIHNVYCVYKPIQSRVTSRQSPIETDKK